MIKTWKERKGLENSEPFRSFIGVEFDMQQEINELRAALVERVPLSNEQIGAALKAACLRDTPESRKDMERAIKAAHSIKES